MKKLRFSNQFKKDANRFRNQPKKMEKVAVVLQMLKLGIPIPKEYDPHSLKGNHKGCMGCHTENDFLLIWIDESANQIGVLRLGSHSELFR